MSEQSRSEHILQLAKELLDDIELGRTNAENLLLKASRLARWVGSDEIRYWVKLEMGGYNSTNPLSLKYMGLTGRWTDKEKSFGYWGPLAQQEAAIEAEKLKLSAMRIPNISSEYAGIAINNVTVAMNASTKTISRLSGIKSRVLARLHTFVSQVYYEKQFDSLSESIFENYKKEVDSLIAANCGDILEKIPSVMSRLGEGEEESVRQALVTCRRIIEAFADSVYPPTDAILEIGGNKLSLDASKHQNRINAFVHQNVSSDSRRKRLRQNLANLYDRVSTGVHREVPPEEAQSLFLNTYLLIGEILHVGKPVVQQLVQADGLAFGEPAA